MNNLNSRRRTRGPQRGRQNVTTAIRQLERRLTGHKTVPANNPPAFVQKPWNSWTFERTEITSADLQGYSITVGDIIDQIRARCNIAAVNNGVANQILIKIQSSQIWCTASGLILPDMDASFYELAGEKLPTTQNVRSAQRDKGTLNMPAKVGYMYPSNDKKDIFGPAESQLLICDAIGTETGSNLIFRVQVLWQSSA